MSDTGRIQEEAELYTAEGRIEVAAIFLVFIFLFLGKVEVADTFPLLIYITFCSGYSPTGDNIGMSPQRFTFSNMKINIKMLTDKWD